MNIRFSTLFQVTSTENAIIFGNIVYDVTGSQSDRNCVVLNDIKIDIMDYIQPASCSDQVSSIRILISGTTTYFFPSTFLWSVGRGGTRFMEAI